MYLVDKILEERGKGQRKRYLVKQEGYLDLTQGLALNLKHTNALKEQKHALEEESKPKEGGTVKG